MEKRVEFRRHRMDIHLIHATEWQHRLVQRQDFVEGQIAVAHGLTKSEREGWDFFPERGELAIEEDFSVGIADLGILKREATEHVNEGLGVATQAVRLARQTVEAHEGLLVVLRGDGFFNVVGLLEASGKIEREGDSEKLLGREGLFLVEQNIRRHRCADEAAEAVENVNGGRVDFSGGGLREEALNDGFGFFFEADIQKGEGFLNARGNFFLAHDFLEKSGC